MFRNNYVEPETSTFSEFYVPEVDSVGRPIGAQPVDQFDAQPFMLGENGFRRSDIAILMTAQSEDLKRSIAARMVEVQSQFPDQTLTDEQLIELTVPRYAQGYSAFRDWSSSLENGGFAKAVNEWIDKNNPKETQKDTIKFDNPEPLNE